MPVLRENLGSKRRVQIEARSRIAAFRAAETAIEMTPFPLALTLTPTTAWHCLTPQKEKGTIRHFENRKSPPWTASRQPQIVSDGYSIRHRLAPARNR